MYKSLKYSIYIVLLLLAVGCSTKKNTAVTRWYHNLTGRYNILFNGEESYKKGMLELEQTYDDNFSELIPLFLYTSADALATIGPEMDRAIKKTTKLVSMHSLTVKPDIKPDKELTSKQKEFYSKKEYNKWVDEAYLLMGKAHFHKMEYTRAKEVFNYIVSNYGEDYTVFEAKMWLARLANEEFRYRESKDILTSLERSIDLPKNLQGEVQATLADFHIKQGNFKEGIVPLKKAIEFTRRKQIKTRYTYLLAQLYSETNENILASEYYRDVIRMNPPYKMTFNARINRALVYQSGSGSKKNIEKELRKMLKDDKNIDYQDQIYYALGNIYFKENIINEAIVNYKLSLETSKDNYLQKAKTNITLADLYYSRPDYMNAQAYYDSAVLLIDKNYPNYQVLYAKSVSLTNLVEHVNTVHFEDSVLALSTLSKAELTELIDKLIDDERQAEEERRFRQQELAEQQIDIQSNRNGFNLANSGSKWYFYNPAIKNIGRKEFGQIWGNRKLEDNWRRKNKSSLSFADLKVDDQLSDMEQQAPDKINGLVTNKRSREFYLQYIPFTDSARQESHDKIAFGLFNMGEIYGAELKDSEKAINAYEELLERYPGYENRLQVYYKLYSIAKLEKDKSRVGIYQQKIVSEFPNSNFAKLMTNPNYVEELLAQDRKVIDEYIATYQLFQLGRFDQVSMRSHKAMEQYPDHELYSRFDYMYTVSAGLRKDTFLLQKQYNPHHSLIQYN